MSEKHRTAESRRNKHANHRAKVRAIVRQAKSRPCADCGLTFPYWKMDLDHRVGEDKEFQLAHPRSITKTLEEIGKCDPVCAGCHRDRTHARQFPEEYAAYYALHPKWLGGVDPANDRTGEGEPPA